MFDDVDPDSYWKNKLEEPDYSRPQTCIEINCNVAREHLVSDRCLYHELQFRQ